jgi:hypothetical protein
MLQGTLLHRLAKALVPEAFYPRNVLARQIARRTGHQVYAGPFRGMRYVEESVGSVYWPKILGSYEKELHSTIERLVALNPQTVIDIGAAEGYYAVGMAMRIPATEIIAFEQTPEGRAHLRSLSELNGVTARLTIHGRCERDSLMQVLPKARPAVLICDVEGYERDLFGEQIVGCLNGVHLLVELHEFVVPGIAEELIRRFSETHRCQRIWQTPRRRADYPFAHPLARFWPAAYATYQLQEFRPERMSWLYAEPHCS